MTREVSVAFINNFPGASIGGGEVQLLELLAALPSAGIVPVLVCAAGSALERKARTLDGVRVVAASFGATSLLSLLPSIQRSVAGATIVQGTGFFTNLLARQVGSSVGAIVVNTMHVMPGAAALDGKSRTSTTVRELLERSSRSRVGCFVAVSQAVADALVSNGVPASRVKVVRNGVDARGLRALASPSAKSPRSAVRIGYVGRLERIKGCEYFIRAVALLARQYPDARFAVAGTGSQDRALKTLSAELGIAERTDFLGYVDPASPLLAALNVVVVPSLSEAAGLTAVEALALGVPVVASRVGGLPEAVIDEETGLLVPPGNPEAIALAVSRLLDDPLLAEQFARAGVQRVEQLFTIERMIDGYLAVYKELAS